MGLQRVPCKVAVRPLATWPQNTQNEQKTA